MILVEPKDIELIVEATTESWTDGRSNTASKINSRRLLDYVKKTVNKAANNWAFQPNDTTTRAAATAQIQVQLDYIHQRNGLTEYKVVCDETNNTPDLIDNGEMKMDIYIKPAKTINFIQLEVQIGRQGVTIP